MQASPRLIEWCPSSGGGAYRLLTLGTTSGAPAREDWVMLTARPRFGPRVTFQISMLHLFVQGLWPACSGRSTRLLL